MPFVAEAVVRDGERRRDAQWIAEVARSAAAQAFVVSRDLRVEVEDERLVWHAVPDGLAPDELIYLGSIDGRPRFAIDGTGSVNHLASTAIDQIGRAHV